MYEITAEQRNSRISQADRTALKEAGMIPSVMYDKTGSAVNIALSRKDVETMIKKRGTSGLVKLHISQGDQKESHDAIFKDLQYDYLHSTVIHLDFQKAYADTLVKIRIPIKGTGTPYGVIRQGGVLQQNAQAAEIRCLPAEIPDVISVEVGPLKLNEIVRAADIKGYEFTLPNASFFTVASSRAARKIAAEDE
jgi:large subunit ribosomal protein L25